MTDFHFGVLHFFGAFGVISGVGVGLQVWLWAQAVWAASTSTAQGILIKELRQIAVGDASEAGFGLNSSRKNKRT